MKKPTDFMPRDGRDKPDVIRIDGGNENISLMKAGQLA